MLLKKRFVTALLVGAIGVSLCATGAMAAKTKDFVPIEDVMTEDTGILIYCSYYNDPEKVAVDYNGKPLAVGISRAAIARTKGEYVARRVQREPGWWMDEAWWQEGFSENGIKQAVDSTAANYRYFTAAPDGTVYYGDSNNGGAFTILYPDGTTKTMEGTRAAYIAVGPDEKVWFVDINHSRNLAFYDPKTRKIEYIAGVSASMNSDSPYIAPDGKVWFRDDAHSGNLASYDPATGHVEYVAGTYAFYTTVAPDGKVWFKDATDWTTPTLSYYNPASGYVRHFRGPYPSCITVAPDGKVWFVDVNRSREGHDNLSFYNPQTGGIEYVAGTDAGLWYSLVAPDGKIWFQDEKHSKSLAYYDPGTRRTAYIPGTSGCHSIHIDEIGNIWFYDRNGVSTVYSPAKDQTRGQ